MIIKPMIGKVFGRLTVIARGANTANGTAQWTCQCECGNRRTIYGPSLRFGRSTSCGCWNAEKSSRRAAERWAEYRRPKTPLPERWAS